MQLFLYDGKYRHYYAMRHFVLTICKRLIRTDLTLRITVAFPYGCAADYGSAACYNNHRGGHGRRVASN